MLVIVALAVVTLSSSVQRCVPCDGRDAADETYIDLLRRVPMQRPIIKYYTRNAWQSLAYSPLGTIVSPPSEYLRKHLLTDHLSA